MSRFEIVKNTETTAYTVGMIRLGFGSGLVVSSFIIATRVALEMTLFYYFLGILLVISSIKKEDVSNGV
jgi:hypothetical protein